MVSNLSGSDFVARAYSTAKGCLGGTPLVALDSGAGTGEDAATLAGLGADVTAVDLEAGRAEEHVEWIAGDFRVLDWDQHSERFNLILLKHVIQYFSDEEVRKIVRRAQQSFRRMHVICVRTFYAQPEPPFPTPVAFLRDSTDLASAFPGSILHENCNAEDAEDHEGFLRSFFTSELIVLCDKLDAH